MNKYLPFYTRWCQKDCRLFSTYTCLLIRWIIHLIFFFFYRSENETNKIKKVRRKKKKVLCRGNIFHSLTRTRSKSGIKGSHSVDKQDLLNIAFNIARIPRALARQSNEYTRRQNIFMNEHKTVSRGRFASIVLGASTRSIGREATEWERKREREVGKGEILVGARYAFTKRGTLVARLGSSTSSSVSCVRQHRVNNFTPLFTTLTWNSYPIRIPAFAQRLVSRSVGFFVVRILLRNDRWIARSIPSFVDGYKHRFYYRPLIFDSWKMRVMEKWKNMTERVRGKLTNWEHDWERHIRNWIINQFDLKDVVLSASIKVLPMKFRHSSRSGILTLT